MRTGDDALPTRRPDRRGGGRRGRAIVLGFDTRAADRRRLAERVSGRVVAVTGGSRGIGAATARVLADHGARVVVLARPSTHLTRAQGVLRGGGGGAIAVDLRDTQAASGAARSLLQQFGVPDVVVSNAGHSIHRYLSEYAERFHDIQRTAAINYLGPIAFLLPLLAAMTQAGRGHLIAVSSTSVDLPLPGWSAYSASKAAFDSWLGAVAPELARDGVVATSIHLPRVRTEMSAPTRGRYPIPELSTPQAATIVARAVVTQPRLVAPWWSRLAGAARSSVPGAVDRVTGAIIARGNRL